MAPDAVTDETKINLDDVTITKYVSPETPEYILPTNKPPEINTTTEVEDPSTVVKEYQPSPVEMAVRAELQDHMQLAKKYQELIKTAKTSVKKTFYRKKLQKNNAKAFQMLVALERLKNKK